jgi:ATP-binding cassette subfamily F protein uup
MKKVNKRFGDKVILKGFDYTFKKGERVGVIGKNGTGKSTFINILMGLEKADSGKINIGETVVFGHYAQEGLEIKKDLRVIEWVKTIAESFPLASGGSLSAAQFLQLFLFEPDKQYTFISKLSGGEKRRLHLLSILFRNPNFLVLDEPTNDLDLPTLAVLEEFLLDFPGCLLIVSHDRYFMDRLVDHLFVFEGEGVVRDFPGNYAQYRSEELAMGNGQLAVGSGQPAAGSQQSTVNSTHSAADSQKPGLKKKQLSYREKREFEQLEKDIPELTKEKSRIGERLNSGEAGFEELQELSKKLETLSRALDEKELRWLELSELA